MIAAVLLLAVLAVTYVLVLRADFNGEDVEEETEEITVLEIEREDISTVRLEIPTARFSLPMTGRPGPAKTIRLSS